MNTSKVNLERYIKQYPTCRRCSAFKVKDKISKGWFRQGSIPWNRGKDMKLPHEYSTNKDTMHDWVERKLGKPMLCSFCGVTESSSFEWSNISGQYKHDLKDFQRLCKRCHILYDYKKFGAREALFNR